RFAEKLPSVMKERLALKRTDCSVIEPSQLVEGGGMLRSILTGSVVVYASSVVASPHRLTSELLHQELVGALIAIDTPLGVSVPVRISPDGLVSGEAGPLASTLGSAKDRGRWWIDQDRLCVKWFRWFDAETRCITMDADGPKIFWRDTSGKS